MIYVRELLLSCRNVDYDTLDGEITLINHNGDELFCFRNLKDFFNAENFNSFGNYVVSYFIAKYKRLTICVSIM